MDTPTILKLREIREGLRQSVRGIKGSDYPDQLFGPEQEYTAQGLIAGIDALTTDMATLIKSPTKFIQTSTYAERNQFITIFSNIQSHLNSKNFEQLALLIDQIKPILRAHGVRHNIERKNEFIEYIDELQRKSTSLAGNITDFQESKKEVEELYSEITGLHEQMTERLGVINEQEEQMGGLIDQTESKRVGLNDLLETDTARSNEIESLLSESKTHKELIDGFSQKISQRETQLEDQENKTRAFHKALDEYTNEQKKYAEDARALIESAKIALEYKTAEGLSAAFIEKYTESKEDKSTFGWIIGSGLFLFMAVFIGIWIVWEKQLEIETVVGRVSLIPMLLAGSWFCAGQYVKQRNLTEDYGYKSVLAKSIVGFSDQLSSESSKGEEYSHYIKSVLSEIHNDPLRKHSVHTKDYESDIKQLIKELKGFQKFTEKLNILSRSGE